MGSKIKNKSWTNELLARKVMLEVYVGVFPAQLSKVNDTGY